MAITTRLAVLLLATLSCLPAVAADLKQELDALARESDTAKYDTPDGDPRLKAFEAIQQRAARLAKENPDRAEPLVREAWALIEQSTVLKNFSSLGLLKQARGKLEAAIALDSNNADAYSTLGSLYFNAPGFPLSFGDKSKGRTYLKKAFATNPTSSWQNLDYAKSLLKDGDYSGAVKHATITLQTPIRPGYKRDAALHAAAEALIAQAKEQSRAN